MGLVLLTDYEHYGHLKKLGAKVRAVTDLLAESGFEVLDAKALTGDGHAFSLLNGLGTWEPASRRLIVYWAGHGKAVEGGRLFLISKETAKRRQPEAHNSVPAASLGDLLAGKDADEIVLLLDACGAGGGAEEIVSAFRAKANSRSYARGFKPGLAVISSAGSHQFAREGAFSSALVSVLRDGPPADPSYLAWTDRDQYVTPAELFQAIRVLLARAPAADGAQVPELDATSGVGRFFPNPRYLLKIPDVGVAEKRGRPALLPSAVAEHFMLKFRGIDTVDDRGWFFTGRERSLRRLVEWLGGGQSGLRVVTGSPGCGKSAILGRMAVLSVPEYRSEVERAGGLAGVPPDTLPPENSLDAGVHAKNLSLDDCVCELAGALQLPAPAAGRLSAADFVRQVASLKRPVALLIDALDEAQPGDVQAIAVDLVRPLSELPDLKILVGTRPNLGAAGETADGQSSRGLLHALGATASDIVRLDWEDDTQADIAAYVRRRLLDSDKSPYRDKPDAATAAAKVVAQRSGRTFLIARILTQELIGRDEVLDAAEIKRESGATWRMLGGSLDTAFTADLTRYGADEWRVRALMLPLAFAEGAGLPSRDVWGSLAEALRSGVESAPPPPGAAPAGSPPAGAAPLGEADLSWLVSNAGAYLIESGEDGQTVYRLYHQALADYFRRNAQWSARDVQRRIMNALLSQVPDIEGRRWDLASPYILRHLATHAEAAGRLPELLGDSRFVLYADPQNLRRTLGRVDIRYRPLARLYLRCVDDFGEAAPADRAAIMQGAALRDEPDALPLLNAGRELPWRGVWSAGLRAAFHQRLPSHASPVTAVAFGRSKATTLVATGAGDGVIRLWNSATGERWGRFNNRSGTVFAVAFHAGAGGNLVIAGGQDGSVTFWEVEEGQLVQSVTAHEGPVFAVALAPAEAGPLLATAGEDGVIRLWNPDTGRALGMLTGHHMPIRALAFCATDDRPILVSGGDDGRVRIWDTALRYQVSEFGGMGWIYSAAIWHSGRQSLVATGSAFGTVRLWDLRTNAFLTGFDGHQGAVGAVAFGELDGRLVLATGGDDGAIRLWDPRSGRLRQTLTRSPAQPVRRRVDDSGHGVLALTEGRSAAEQPDADPEDVVTGVGRASSVQALAWGKASGTPLLASGDGDWTPRLWEPASHAASAYTDTKGRPVGLVVSLAVGHVDGYQLVVEGCEDGTVRLREAVSGRTVRALDAHHGPVTATAFGSVSGSPVVASGGSDGVVRMHDARTGALLQTFDARTRQAPVAHVDAVLVTEVKGRPTVLTANGRDDVTCWDPLTGQQTGLIEETTFSWRLALGQLNGRPALLSARRFPHGGVFVRDLTSRSSTSLGRGDVVRAIAFTDVGGKALAATADEGGIRIWDLATKETIHRLPVPGPVNGLAFSDIGGRPVLVSAGLDRTVRLWLASTGESLGRLADHAAPITAVIAFADNLGRPLVCTGADDGTHLIRLSATLLASANPGKD